MGFSTGQKNNYTSLSHAPSYRVFVVVVVASFIRESSRQFQNSTLVEPILNSTSDPRQDEQLSPFTTSSSQKGNGKGSCWASIVAERNNPSLMEHERQYSPIKN